MNGAGVEQAVKRFFDNDPYYPRPCTVHQEAEGDWMVFSTRHLQVSTFLRRQDSHNTGGQVGEAAGLPLLFLAKVNEKMVERENEKRIPAMRSRDTWSDFESRQSESIGPAQRDRNLVLNAVTRSKDLTAPTPSSTLQHIAQRKKL